jgi:amidohydrolase
MLDSYITGKIEESSAELEDLLIDVRRHLHKNPELSRQEYQTTAYISALLEREGISVTRWDDCTGLFASVGGRRKSPLIALRCEIDAIGMEDVKKVPYASRVPNVMHACGHDVHTTIVLGTAITCNRLNEHLNGSIKFIFQPAEEVVPGGSLELIKRNVMDGVDVILGFHSDPTLRVGYVGLKEGPVTAGADMFDITIIGKSGHTARPHYSKDTILCAAKVVDSLHQVIEREIDPREPFVLTIGKIHSGISPNVIPERAEISGTVRMINEETREKVPDLIERVTRGITESMGASYSFDYYRGSPPVVNDSGLIRLIEEVTVSSFGREKVVPMQQSMGGEDFSWYLDHAPGALIRLGVTKDGIGPSLHSNIFDVNEESLGFGVSLLSRILATYLDKH